MTVSVKPKNRDVWAVFNQSQPPIFQKMMEDLSVHIGQCLLYTGTPYEVGSGCVRIEAGPRYQRQSMITRIISWVKYSISSLYRLLRMNSDVFVLAVTNPPLLPHLAWIVNKLKGTRYGLIIWDIYPDHLVKAGILTKQNYLVRLWVYLNCKSMMQAAVVVTIGEKMAEALQTQLKTFGLHKDIHVIPNWADTSFLKPMDKTKNPFAIKHNQVGQLTVLYSGNIGETHDLSIFIEAAIRLREFRQISFLIIGEGLGLPAIKNEARVHELQNIQFIPRQSWDMVPFSLSTGDVAIVAQAKGSEHLSVPSKTYSMLAVGCEIIAYTSKDSDLAKLVVENDVGIVCEHGNIDGLVSELCLLMERPERLLHFKQSARIAAERYYSSTAVFNKFKETLGNVI